MDEQKPGEMVIMEMTPAEEKRKKAAAEAGRLGLNVCVFCSAKDLEEKFTAPAEEFARILAERGHTLVWGGSDVGLMKAMATGAQEAGAHIIGVSVAFLEHTARQNADEMIIAKDLGERKAIMLSRSDALVMLVGGIGTLDEVTEVIEHKKHGHHQKPIVVLNTDGFYNGLRTQLLRMAHDGMLHGLLEKLVYFAETPQDAMAYIEQTAEQ